MDVKLLYFDDCANWQTADRRLRQALSEAGIEADVDYQLVQTFGDAERLGFRGSPTILFDGKDPFAEPSAPIGFACRLYETEGGPDGSPSVSQLLDAISQQLGQPTTT